MPPYAEQTTAELIALLFKEEDRVTLEHIQELAQRGDEAVEPLREILRNEKYWLEGRDGEFWIEMHAVTTLSAMRAVEALPDLTAAIVHAYHSENDWVFERLATALAHFGEPAIEPLMQFISQHRDGYHQDHDYSYARDVAATALTRIGVEHPAERERILDFLCGLLTDPLETDETFLSFMADKPMVLDRERGFNALRIAYEREAIDENICGDYDDFVERFGETGYDPFSELKGDLFEFYQLEEIAQRQRRWKTEEELESKRFVAGVGPAMLSSALSSSGLGGWLDDKWDDEDDEAENDEPPALIPAGYMQTNDGTLLRAEHVGRNDPCHCGSGKKFKKCCG